MRLESQGGDSRRLLRLSEEIRGILRNAVGRAMS